MLLACTVLTVCTKLQAITYNIFMCVCVFIDEIRDHFIQFGSLTVDWPHKAQSKAYFPPKGTV